MAKRYWVIAPYFSQKKKLFKQMWQYCLSNDVIAIGFYCLGDVRSMGKEELERHYRKNYVVNGRKIGFKRQKFESLWDFLHEISDEDILIAREGLGKIIGKGTVKSKKTFFDEKRGKQIIPDKYELYFPNFREVVWEEFSIKVEGQKFLQHEGFLKEMKKEDLIKNAPILSSLL